MARTTFKDLKDGLADYIATTTTSPRWSDATRGEMVNRAIDYICRKYDLRWNESTATIALVPGQQNYTLPTDYSRPFYAWFLDPVTAQARQITFLTKDRFDALYPNPALTANPGNFTVYGSTLQFGKVPSDALNVTFLYYSRPAELVADADSNALTLNAWQAVFDRSLVESADYLIDDDRMDVWLRRWRETENALLLEAARSRSTGLIPQSMEPS